MQQKVAKKLDNCIWIWCLKISQLRREYLSSAVNMLKKKTVLRCYMSLKKTFPYSIFFSAINKYDKRILDRLPCCLSKGLLERKFFLHLSNHVFRSLLFRKYISYDGHHFPKNNQNLIKVWKMRKKIPEKFFIS